MTLSHRTKSFTDAVNTGKVPTAMLKKIVSLVDLTSLNPTDSEESIASLCAQASSSLGMVAAICVYPRFVRLVAAKIGNKPISIATVTNFPGGTMPIESAKRDIAQAIADGANEIDVVFPYLRYFAGDKHYARSYVQSCKEACGKDVKLKVILESGAFADLATLAAAGEDACKAGADFIKTCTGKIKVGATLEAVGTLLVAMKRLRPLLNRDIGLKVSGGVSTFAEATQYIRLTENIMGADWVNKDRFRFGSSSLVANLSHR